MKRAAGRELGVSRQRGFWLRVFLGHWIWICFAAGMMFPAGAKAQIEIITIHLSRVHGFILDRAGGPIANAAVSLEPATGGSTVCNTESDVSGRFRIRCDDGSYWLRIKAAGFSSASEHVIVGSDLRTVFQRKTLYEMLGPSACMDQCSWVFTSKRKLEEAVRENERGMR